MSKDVRGSLKNFQVRNILYDETKRGPTDLWEKIALSEFYVPLGIWDLNKAGMAIFINIFVKMS